MKVLAAILIIVGFIFVTVACIIALIIGGPILVLITLAEAAIGGLLVVGVIALIKKLCD